MSPEAAPPVVAGFRFAGVEAGIKKRGGPDVALIVADGLVACAGVFTTNLVVAAPVDLAQLLGRAQLLGEVVGVLRRHGQLCAQNLVHQHVVGLEAVGLLGLHVEHAQQAFADDQRHGHLRARLRQQGVG